VAVRQAKQGRFNGDQIFITVNTLRHNHSINPVRSFAYKSSVSSLSVARDHP
jgi:hypothetical protein